MPGGIWGSVKARSDAGGWQGPTSVHPGHRLQTQTTKTSLSANSFASSPPTSP